MAMLDVITPHLCREYTIACPACGVDNQFPRLKRDIYSTRKSGPDGQPLEIKWRADVEFPEWLTPLNYFWGVCRSCFFTAQLDDTEYRTWKKNAAKYRNQFREGVLETIADLAHQKKGAPYKLGTSLPDDDIFGTMLVKFYLGIFTECQKVTALPGSLARSYLRIAWIFRDEKRLYGDFAPQSGVRALLEESAPLWAKSIPDPERFPLSPGLATDEVSALRYALAYFEWNYRELQSSAYEDELRLMTLIAEIGYRIYERTGSGDDFTKAQSLFSGTMQKSMAIINDKTIVGGAVTRAKDTLEKAGDRGRQLRALQQKWEKSGKNPRASTPAPQPKASEETKPEVKQEPPTQAAKPSVFDAPQGNVQALQERIEQLDADNKRWMRLAGISSVTGLPNHVMLSRVLLPGAFRQASQRKEPIGCILLAPKGLQEVNGKYGRAKGDAVLKKFAACIQNLLRKGERLCHMEGVNFALLVPRMTAHQLEKRAEAIHKDLCSRRFELGTEALSLTVSVGVAVLSHPNGQSDKVLINDLLERSQNALDRAKIQGNRIEVAQET